MAEIEKHEHIVVETPPETVDFTATRSFGAEFRTLPRVRKDHGELLERQWRAIWAKHDEHAEKSPAVVVIPAKEGIYVHFEGAPDCNLKTDSLENKQQGIILLNSTTKTIQSDDDEHNVESAVVYVPINKRNYFLNRVEQYIHSEPSSKGNFKHQKLMESIETIKSAFWDAMWTGKEDDRPTDISVWCEAWLRNDGHTVSERNVENTTKFFKLCDALKIEHRDSVLFFPERNVCLIKANADQLQLLLDNCDYVAEFRRASETAAFFVEQTVAEQKAWVDELASRMDINLSNTAICILDTGVNFGHPLLENVISAEDVQTVNAAWGSADQVGHGTEMCGIATFFNLQKCMESHDRVSISHRIESVKIIPKSDSDDNDPDLYGETTRQAIYLSEIEKPDTNRVICLAITSDKYNTEDGSPTSWSGEIDNITSGAHDGKKRLILVAGGNVYPYEVCNNGGYPAVNQMKSIHSPGQAWNAITVGAYSGTATPQEQGKGNPVAKAGDLSPYSTTSVTWDKKWPIKPEILCDGGNMISDGTLYSESDAFSLLTTANNIQSRLLTTIWGTSSATAQAANIAAQVCEKYPAFWPETVRAIIIHSAAWTPEMISMCGDENKTKRGNLLRTCGYGIPSLEKALYTLNNNVNMVIQGEMIPYKMVSDKKSKSKRIATNEMHIHNLPWPKDVLLDLGELPVTARITLSYFIEPGPGNIGWKDRYRYPSCLLRFDLNNSNENLDDFRKRINRAARDDDSDSGDGTSGSDRWYLGKSNRNVGSVHSDIWHGTAAELSQCNHIGVFPAVGWWKERAYLRCFNKPIRYALVVSLETQDQSVDLYTPIKIQIAPRVEIST